jgi:hypothetical protein
MLRCFPKHFGEGDVRSDDGMNCFWIEECSQIFIEGFQKQLTANSVEISDFSVGITAKVTPARDATSMLLLR